MFSVRAKRTRHSFQEARRMLLCSAMKKALPALVLLSLVCAISCTGKTKVFSDPNSAMEPTILKDEKFAASMESFQPVRGDLILFEHDGVILLKRVIGKGGDVVEGRGLQVFVNGKAVNEPYVQHLDPRPPETRTDAKSLFYFGPTSVPAGKLFVAGDNRDFSFDSRDPRFGLISESDVKGRPEQIVESPNPQRVHQAVR